MEIDRSTLFRWRQDTDFRALVDEVVRASVVEAVQRLRSLAPEAVEAFERGLRANTRFVATREGEIVGLPDDSLAVRTADLVTKRIAELTPREGLDVELSASEQLAALIRRLDAADGKSDSDRGTPARPS